MAHYADECVSCVDKTKKSFELCLETKQKGKLCYIKMYSCEKLSCRINKERLRGEKELRLLNGKIETKGRKEDEICSYRSRRKIGRKSC